MQLAEALLVWGGLRRCTDALQRTKVRSMRGVVRRALIQWIDPFPGPMSWVHASSPVSGSISHVPGLALMVICSPQQQPLSGEPGSRGSLCICTNLWIHHLDIFLGVQSVWPHGNSCSETMPTGNAWCSLGLRAGL